MNIHDVYALFMRRFRPRRAKEIALLFPLLNDPQASVLDIGGGAFPWAILDPAARVTILNIRQPHGKLDCKWEFVVGDGTQLEFPDQSFDLVFSNSVIEHVGDSGAQQRFAREMIRVGKRIYCQTPNKWFPVEPHLITTFIHWLPFTVSRRLIRYFSVWGVVAKPTQADIDRFLATTRLLAYSEIRALFPGCDIRREKVLGLSKSYIVIKQG